MHDNYESTLMQEKHFSRRAFLKGSGALALSTPLVGAGAFAGQNPEPKTQQSCIVIGAGLSGLTAAYRLRRSGWNVTVVEARNRIGGRVWTHHDSQTGLSFELGGEWIGENHARMIALCRHFGLPLQSKKVVRVAHREYSQSAQRAWEKFTAAWPHYSQNDRRNLDRYDWWTWLQRIGYSENDLRLRDRNDSVGFGESIRQVSAYQAAVKNLETNAGEEMVWKINGGNDRLPRALENKIGKNNFRLNTNVTEIIQKNGKVFVRAGHETLHADACVCTVPARVLSHIRFRPELPAKQLKAAWELQYTRVVKSAVTFERQFWKDGDFAFVSDTTSRRYFYASQKQLGQMGVLTSCAIGDEADILASQGTARRQQMIARDLKNFDERAPQLVRSIVSHAWQRDPFSQGAIALYHPKQCFIVRLTLGKPHGRIFFAGEHLADCQGSMEGAVETGEAAADAILQT